MAQLERLHDTAAAHVETPGNAAGGSRWAAPAIVILLAIASTVYFFRQSLFSRFQLLNGDNGDTRILIAILEHWSAVFAGRADMRSPNFFWPLPGMLGYSDAMFLYWPPYALARALGFDLFVSLQLTLIFFKAVGFASMYCLLRSCLRSSMPAAVLGAVLFTISNLYSVAIGASHSHLVVVNCVPLLAVLGCRAWRLAAEPAKRGRAFYAVVFGAYLGLLFFTSYYIAWFSVLAAGLALIVAWLIRSLEAGSALAPLRSWADALRQRKLFVALAALSFAIAIVPFLMTYLPVLKQTGGRFFSEVLLYSARPLDILNVGGKNRLWGHPLDRLFIRVTGAPMQVSEAQSGWPPLILLLCLVSIVMGLKHRRDRSIGDGFLMAWLGLAFLLDILLPIKIGDASLWWFVFKLVPGGSAIRAPARFNHVTNILLILAVCLLSERLWRRSRAIFWVLALLLVAEQLNRDHIARMSHATEVAVLARAPQPPATCRSFFLAKAAPGDRLWYVDQLDAVLIARRFNLPTMNGYSGWQPPGWHLEEINSSYLQHVREWATAHNIAQGVCGLDLTARAWAPYDLSATPYTIGSVIDFHKNGNAAGYEAQGWSGEEETGSWTVGPKSSIELTLSEVPRANLVLLIQAHAFINRLHTRFEESVVVDGQKLADWIITDVPVQKKIVLPPSLLAHRKLRIEFLNSDPRSPAELGMWADTRKLDLGMETIRLAPE